MLEGVFRILHTLVQVKQKQVFSSLTSFIGCLIHSSLIRLIMFRYKSGPKKIELLSPEEIEKHLAKENKLIEENNIILITVFNPIYDINVDTVSKICKGFG